MQFAIYNNERKEAEPRLKGLCLHCQNEVLAKCGAKNIWHWAHMQIHDCDSWKEPETFWHRNWKTKFGTDCSEVRIQKESGYHIADVVNKNGIVFEFQNSVISAGVIMTRENFYGNKMIWIINGISFRENFKIYDEEFIKRWQFKILDEFSAANYKDIKNSLIVEAWQIQTDMIKDFLKQNNFVYYRKEKIYALNLDQHRHYNREQLILKLNEELLDLYNLNKTKLFSTKVEFVWEHYRRSWEEARRPVFIDFGEDFLILIVTGMGKKYGTGHKIFKSVFIQKYC